MDGHQGEINDTFKRIVKEQHCQSVREHLENAVEKATQNTTIIMIEKEYTSNERHVQHSSMWRNNKQMKMIEQMALAKTETVLIKLVILY